MPDVVDIDMRWEPLGDRFLIDRLDGATHKLHTPVRLRFRLDDADLFALRTGD